MCDFPHHLVCEWHLVTESMNVGSCLWIQFVHTLSTELQKRRTVPVKLIQFEDTEGLHLRCDNNKNKSSNLFVNRLV